MNNLPKSKGTWGREAAKSPEELSRLAVEFFSLLKLPIEWKFEGYDRAEEYLTPDPSPTGEGESKPKLIIHSIGALFTDTRTRGLDIKRYRVCFHTWSGRGAIVEKSMIDFGEYKKECIIMNKTAEKLNEFIDDNFRELKKELAPSEIDPDDGLQHFRDRFADRVAD
ncbi:MAG: hypothetical protein EOM47_06520 [Bacteroidia bacterium]|nr:hypothetical protein [Bacteroidia bacterium]